MSCECTKQLLKTRMTWPFDRPKWGDSVKGCIHRRYQLNDGAAEVASTAAISRIFIRDLPYLHILNARVSFLSLFGHSCSFVASHLGVLGASVTD
jgi:hypothetical protein